MDNTRIIPVRFGKERLVVTEYRMQHDWGQVLDFIDIPLPEAFEARFSNSVSGQSVGQIGYNNRVRIPKQFFESGEPIYCYITLHDEETDGRTLYTTKVPIKPSSERTEEEPEPEEESIITQAITALNTAVDVTSQKALEASESADRAEHAADGIEAYVERAEAAQQASESARDKAEEAKTSAQESATSTTESLNEVRYWADIINRAYVKIDDWTQIAYGASQQAIASEQASTESARQASQSAETASTKAQEASGFASEASQKASEAAQSAQTATQAKTDAESAKTASQTAQGLAETARNEAVSAKTGAESARDEAQTLVDSITGKVEQIDYNTDRIESLEGDRYKPYAVDSASGSIASFPDGADNIPLKSCIVQVEPVQDLHGYDSPWPAGGGINLFDIDNIITVVGAYGLTTSIDGDIVRISGTYTGTSGSAPYRIIYHDQPIIEDAKFAVFRLDTSSIRISCRYASTSDNSIVVAMSNATPNTDVDVRFRFMIYTGSTVPATYSPYSNICPISGWTGCEVQRTGKNIFGGEAFRDAVLAAVSTATTGEDENGRYVTITAGSASHEKVLFEYPWKENTVYTFIYRYKKNNTNGVTNLALHYKDGTYNYLSKSGGVEADTVYTEVLKSSQYKLISDIRAIWGSGTATIYYDYFGIFEGDISVDYYVPYTGHTYPITFPSEAGTVYGGTLDVTSGELVVDRYFANISTVVNKNIKEGTGYFWFNTSGNIGIPAIKGTNAKLISNRFAPFYNVNETTGDGLITFYANNIIRWKEHGEMTLAEYKAYLAENPFELCYELAEPIHYPLTPTEIKTLLGQNNLWADTGNVSVEYRADTTLYISRLTEPDADMIADSNITSGSYFMVGNNLYRATVNIASGASVIVGTNAVKISLAQALNEINA